MPPKPAVATKAAVKPTSKPNKGSAIKGKGKGKGKGKQKQKRHKLNLKGWLKTAADWARFNAWAKINALPRKIPEPEPVVRESRPLSQLRKRLEIISKPSAKSDVELICRLDLSVSKAALSAKPSKRIKELATFVWKDEELCKESPNPITKAALNYKPSPRIVEIAKPHIHEIESCHALEISTNALMHKTTKREKKMSLAKKAQICPNSLTDDEIARLFTPEGIKRSALSYKITDWVSILALPSYRFLKDRRDPEAKSMKKQIEESEDRGKKVLEEQRKKEEEKAEKEKKKKGKGKKGRSSNSGTGGKNDQNKNQKKPEEEENKNEDQTTGAGKKDEEKNDEKKSKERKKWRTEPGPCKTNLSISKAALTAKASARTEEIAKPHIHVSKSCRPDAFGVKKSALGGSASARVSEMAKPTHPLDPVERPPPREKDAYGAPIFPKPKFGKRLPKAKPYKMGECKDKDDKKDEKKSVRRAKPVSLFPSIDPCIDPIRAKKQAKARKDAEELEKANKEKKKKMKKEKKDEEIKSKQASKAK